MTYIFYNLFVLKLDTVFRNHHSVCYLDSEFILVLRIHINWTLWLHAFKLTFPFAEEFNISLHTDKTTLKQCNSFTKNKISKFWYWKKKILLISRTAVIFKNNVRKNRHFYMKLFSYDKSLFELTIFKSMVLLLLIVGQQKGLRFIC